MVSSAASGKQHPENGSKIQPRNAMLVELSIIPIGNGSHIADELADVLKLVEQSGLPFELTPTATCIEGTWDEVMPLIRRCHERVLVHCPHVMTNIQIEDDGDRNKLVANVVAIEEKLGHPLRRNHHRTSRAVAP